MRCTSWREKAAMPFQHGAEVRAPVRAGEGVDLVDDHEPQVREQLVDRNAAADQHRFQALGRGQQQLGRLGQKVLARRLPHAPVPLEGVACPAARPGLTARSSWLLSRATRGLTYSAPTPPAARLAEQHVDHRQERRFRLAARRGGQHDHVLPGEDGGMLTC